MQWHASSKWPDVSQQLQWFANGHSQRLDLVMTTPHLGRATVRRTAPTKFCPGTALAIKVNTHEEHPNPNLSR